MEFGFVGGVYGGELGFECGLFVLEEEAFMK